MPFDTRCPECGEEYHFPDAKRGKSVECGNCDHTFVAGEDRKSGRDGSRESIQEGKAKKADGYWNSERENEGPRERTPFDPVRGKSGRPAGKPVKPDNSIIYIGITAFMLLAGAGLGLWVWLDSGKDREEQAKKKTDIERLLQNVQSGDASLRREAARMLNAMPNDETLRHRIVGALRQLQDDADVETKAAALQAIARWEGGGNPIPGQPTPTPMPQRQLNAEELGVPALLSRLQGHIPGHDKHPAMTELARRKEPSGVKLVANYLTSGHDRGAAMNALRAYGPMAQGDVLPFLNHPDGGTRDAARTLLREFNTPTDLLLTQGLSDLQNPDRNVQFSALVWVGELQAIPAARRKELSAVLEKYMADRDGRFKENAMKGLRLCGSKENAEMVARLLQAGAKETFPTNTHRWAMEAVGQWQDPRAASALMLYLTHPFMHNDAVKALQQIGPEAAKEVLKAMNHPDGGAQARARQLLKGYGTSEDDMLVQSLEDIRSAETARRRAALDWIAQAKPSEKRRGEVAKSVGAFLKDRDHGIQEVALRATKTWLHRESVPGLIAMAEDPKIGRNRFLRHQVLEMLGTSKDERAIPVLVRLLSSPFERGTASQALKKMGPIAEDEVLKCLTIKDNQVRGEACRILQEIGTSKSLVVLVPLTTDRDFFLATPAKQAVQAINSRLNR